MNQDYTELFKACDQVTSELEHYKQKADASGHSDQSFQPIYQIFEQFAIENSIDAELDQSDHSVINFAKLVCDNAAYLLKKQAKMQQEQE